MAQYELAFIIERYFEFGGLQRDMQRFALACARAGHKVTVFTSCWDSTEQPPFKVEIVDFKMSANHQTIKKIEDFVHDLRQANRFDCIIGFNRVGGLDIYYGGDTCLKAKLRQQHRMWLRFLPRYRTYLELEAAVFGPKSKMDIMLISPTESATFQQVYQTAPDRIHLLPPGIDRDRLLGNPLTGEKRNQFRRTLDVRDEDFLILAVGSSFQTKGIDRTIAAIAALPDELKNSCRYIVVGLGNQKKFQAIAQQKGIGNHISFTGGRRDISNFYYAADVLLHPARTENTGTVLLEAMVVGLPVIATENCGYAHYITQANAGQICPVPFDQLQFNSMLTEILAHDERRIQYSKNGCDFCKNADIYSMIEKGVRVIVRRAQKNRENQ
ncbi:MAG: glycosyltransferase family 4 protein [Sedimentisphaerales bacterium]|nr:glycosyltransferase family 4 protein [Sedimentisphaerales bacterium]